jgi:hypothetical protein
MPHPLFILYYMGEKDGVKGRLIFSENSLDKKGFCS